MAMRTLKNSKIQSYKPICNRIYCYPCHYYPYIYEKENNNNKFTKNIKIFL